MRRLVYFRFESLTRATSVSVVDMPRACHHTYRFHALPFLKAHRLWKITRLQGSPLTKLGGLYHQVEAAQDASAPVVRRPNYLWWSASYHMQNPVENLEPGTRLVFTVKDQSTEVVPNGRRAVAGGGDIQELGWGMIHVNRSTMNSQVSVRSVGDVGESAGGLS